MIFDNYEIWWITGAQLLYGGDAVVKVDSHSKEMVDGLNNSGKLPVKVVYKGTANSSREVADLMTAANNDPRCAGVITWMHTFSPAKMWIHGLQILNKPMLHFHTQYNAEIPWDTMDMDFMNLNQSAGDKVEAEIRMGYHVDYCPFSEVLSYFHKVADADVDALVETYFKEYDHEKSLEDKSTEAYRKIWNSAKAELTLRAILTDKGAKGFTTNFDDLGDVNVDETGNGFDQIPGLASQRLMAEGYGFGAEGDWKSAALYRTVWVMSQGRGCSFLEDYTLNFDGKQSAILQAHMLEVCPLIAEQRPRLEVHFLGIGYRKTQTARLVFTSRPGYGVTATVVDMGNRFRLIVNDVDCIKSKPLPKLPVASALWIPQPSFEIGATAWILAGGTHHSCFSYVLTPEYWEDYAEMAGIEMVHIDKNTTIENFKQNLRLGEVYYMLNRSFYK